MRLLRYGAKNFMLIRDESVDLEQRGLVLVEGENRDDDSAESNASAKSTLFSDLPSFIFFGVTTRGLKGSAVVNWTAKRDCHAWAEFEAGGYPCRIDRFVQHREEKNRVILTVGGEDRTCSTNAKTDDAIQRLIGCSQDIWSYTTVLGQGMSDRFSRLSPSAKQRLLEDIADLAIYDRARAAAKARNVDATRAAQRAEARYESAKAHLADLRRVLSDLRERQEEEQDAIQGEITRTKAELKDAEARFAEASRKAEMAGDRVEEVSRALREAERSLAAAEATLREAKRRQRDRERGECPTCGQPWPHDTEQIPNEVEEAEAKVKAANTKVAEVRLSYERLGVKADEWESKADEWESKVIRLRSRLDELDERLASCDKSAIERVEREVGEARSKMVDAKRASKRAAMLSTHYDVVANTVFPVVRSYALAEVVSIVNESLDRYVDILFGGDVVVKLNHETELKSGEKRAKVSLEVSNRQGDYKSSSGGEADKVDLAVAFALHDAVQSISGFAPNFLVVDEPANAVDSLGLSLLVKALREKLSSLDAIFLVSHRPDLKGYADDVVRVVREGGYSRLLKERA